MLLLQKFLDLKFGSGLLIKRHLQTLTKTIDEDLFTSVLDQEMTQLIELRGDSNFDQANLDRAIDLFHNMSTSLRL